ncbi:MAG: GDP-mannose 4,6-dehydratase [Leptospiraceae bacterium]|nr:GDP-mannose 4,6-dehydratase [Leptospiraceae bacterium]
MQRGSALITGAGGQDGYYLGRLLQEKGYEVHGLDKEGQQDRMESIDKDRRWTTSLFDTAGLSRLLQNIQPREVYHLAAFSFVNTTSDEDRAVLKNNVEASHNLLSVLFDELPESRFCLASSAEIFGNANHSPQSEQSAIQPSTIYGVSKAACHHLVGMYRMRGFHASSAILFNHESPRRGPRFVTQKIVRTAVAIQRGEAQELCLGNVDTVRDWGFAGDYVEALWTMLQSDSPADYVVATGHGHTVRDFAGMVFEKLGLKLEDWLRFDESLARPPESFPRVGDASWIKERLGWKPKHDLADLVDMMVEAELQRRSDSSDK